MHIYSGHWVPHYKVESSVDAVTQLLAPTITAISKDWTLEQSKLADIFLHFDKWGTFNTQSDIKADFDLRVEIFLMKFFNVLHHYGDQYICLCMCSELKNNLFGITMCLEWKGNRLYLSNGTTHFKEGRICSTFPIYIFSFKLRKYIELFTSSNFNLSTLSLVSLISQFQFSVINCSTFSI